MSAIKIISDRQCKVHNEPHVVRIRSRKGGGTYPETRCLKCQALKAKEWYQINGKTLRFKQARQKYADKNKTAFKNDRLKRQYGIDIIQYNQLLSAQNGCCAICNRHNSKFTKALSVDHCHITGNVRGLLCSPCNQALGLLQDNIFIIEKASIYLKEYKK